MVQAKFQASALALSLLVATATMATLATPSVAAAADERPLLVRPPSISVCSVPLIASCSHLMGRALVFLCLPFRSITSMLTKSHATR